MAEFVSGEKITASKLNEINSAQVLVDYNPRPTSWWGETYDKKWYSHREAGAVLVEDMHISIGGFGGVAIRLARVDASNNVISWILNEDIKGWTGGTERDYSFNSLGPGWYRLWFFETSNPMSSYAFRWKLYSSQTNCIKGNYLTLYDDPLSSGNRLSGTYLRVADLNSGRAGTINP